MWPFNNKDKKYEQFSSDKCDHKTRFKALIAIQKEIGSSPDRKKWHETHCHHVFNVCRNGLEEYSKAPSKKDLNFEDPQRVCDIINCLTMLCQDIPEMLTQKWNSNAITQLLTKFLHYQTNEQIRYEALNLAYVIINGCKDKTAQKYVQLFAHAVDFTPFCSEGSYAKYEPNFKQHMIIAPEPIPWVRKARPSQQNAVKMFKKILDLVLHSNDFDFWYGFLVENFYPQLFHQCTYDYQHLIYPDVKLDDEKTKEIKDVEGVGFGSGHPPVDILTSLIDWIWTVINNEQKWSKLMKTELHMRYMIEIIYRTVNLPLSANSYTFRILRCIEFWMLGFKVSEEFKSKYQEYFREIFERIALMFELWKVAPMLLPQKLQLSGFVLYLFRIAAGQPYVNWEPQSWKVITGCQLATIIKVVKNNIKDKDCLSQFIYPLIHSALKSLVLCSIADPSTANSMFEALMRILGKIINYSPFVIVWREMVRTLTVETLKFHSDNNDDEDEENGSRDTNKPKARNYRQSTAANVSKLPFLLQDSTYEDFYKQPFEIEDRCTEINVDSYKFSDFDQAYMIWDRMLHLLGDPTKNNDDVSRRLQLEGFTDALKLFIIALNSVPVSKARQVKDRLKNITQTPTGSTMNLITPLERVPDTSPQDPTKEYGFSFSTIPVLISISDLEHFSPAITDVLPLPPRHLLPQNNTLARMFAPFLFNICSMLLKKEASEQEARHLEFDMAFESLAHIVFTASETILEDEILAQFYEIILESLQTPSARIRNIVVRECAKGCIFGKNLKGIHVLVPSFLEIIKQSCGVGKKAKSNGNEPKMVAEDMTDALSIASTLISCGPHFQNCKISILPSNSLQKNQYKCEFSQLKQVLLEAYQNACELQEPKPEFANLVMSGLTLMIFDELASTRDIKLLKTALRCMLGCTNPAKLSYAVYATRALDDLSIVCGQMYEISPDLISDTIFPSLINHGMEYVKMASAATVSRSRTVCNVGSDLIFCLLAWIFNFPPALLQNADLIGGTLKVLSQALEYLHTIPEGKKLHELTAMQQLVIHAKTAMLSLFHYLNNYPLRHDPGAISSNAADIKPPQGLYLINDNNSIINVSDGYVSHERGPERGVRMVVREDSGKYCWKFTPCSIRARSRDYTQTDNNAKPEREKKSPIGLEQSQSEIESRGSLDIDENEVTDEKKEDIKSEIETIRRNTVKRIQLPTSSDITLSLKEKPRFEYDLVSHTDGLSQVLRYIDQTLVQREKPKESNTKESNTKELTTKESNKRAGTVTMVSNKSNHMETPTKLVESKSAITLPKIDDNEANPTKYKRYSLFGALPSGTLTEPDNIKLSANLLAHESEEKELNETSKPVRDRQSKNVQSSDHTRNGSNELVDSQTTPTSSPSNSPVLATERLSQEDENMALATTQRAKDLNLDPHPQAAITCLNQFDCSRFLFSHLGLLTCGQIIGVGDFEFSFIETRKMSGQYASSSAAITAAPLRHTMKQATRKDVQQTRQNIPRAFSDAEAPTTTEWPWDSIVGKIDLTKYQAQLAEETLGVIPAIDAETMQKRLDLMDRSQGTTREFHKIGVEYVGRDQDQQRYILGNNEGSYGYEKFVDDLGWLVDLTVHEGFFGGLALGSTGRYACYYSTGTYEMIFHVVTRMPPREGDTQYTERKRHVGNDHVNIVWSEHTRNYLPETISTDFNTVTIVIYPLENGLFRVQVHKKINVGHFGPLTNNMVVRQHVLAPLVRLTALEANRTVQTRNIKFRLSYRERRINLEDYYKKWQKKDGPSVLAGFFPSLTQQ